MRHRTRYGGSEARARAAAFLLLGLRGTPFLYAGEELGLEDAVVPPERVVDPGGRDGCRAPIPWTPAPDHGWGPPTRGCRGRPSPTSRNAEVAAGRRRVDRHLYRRAPGRPTIEPGAAATATSTLLDAPDGVVGWRPRRSTTTERVVLVGFRCADDAVRLEGDWVVEVASNGAGEGEPFSGPLAADQAVVLRPA